MTSTNLIPSYRLLANRRKRRLRWWITGAAVYLAALLGAYACCYALWGTSRDAMVSEQVKMDIRIHQAKRHIGNVQEELAAAERMLNANRAVQSHPDWSLLLGLLAKGMSDDVILRQCMLGPEELFLGAALPASAVPVAAPTSASGPGSAYVLKVTGYAKTVAAASQFALELERTTLFDDVRLLKTNRQPFLEGEAVLFQIECSLSDKVRKSEKTE